MVESKEYQSALKILKTDTARNLALQELNRKYRLTEYSLHQFVKPMQHHFKKNLDSHRIKTVEVKASQYNHAEDHYLKKELSERWTMIGEDKIQRDLYSSFLIMNVNPDLSSINRKQCLERYSKFKTFHDREIERLKTSTNRKLASMGI